MITATRIRDVNPSATGHQALYELSESVPWGYNYDTGKPEGETTFVVVSAANVPMSGPEVYIFPSDGDGNVIDWVEMDGSLRGTMSHEDAIAGAGWVTK